MARPRQDHRGRPSAARCAGRRLGHSTIFLEQKTPQQTADVVAALIRTFMTKWHADKVALVGYSFGADVMPFAYNLLPPSLRDHVVLISLLGLSKSADFEISVRGWLGEPPGPDAFRCCRKRPKSRRALSSVSMGRTKLTRRVLRLRIEASKPSAGTALITTTATTGRSPMRYLAASKSGRAYH